MKRMLVAAIVATALASSPALAASLLNLPITTAVTAQAQPARQFRRQTLDIPRGVAIQCKFTYGSGGTTFSAWVQTSIDGANWIDVYNCSGTTASLTNVVNLSSLTPVTTAYVPTDGTLTANTVKDGIIANWWRVKVTTTGTYAGGTTLAIDLSPGGLQP